MTRMLLAIGSTILLSIFVAGCYQANVQVPDYGGWGQAPPPATIAPANPNDKADLVRENQELHARLAWVENQNRKLAHRYNTLADDMAKARAKRDQYASDRDHYKAVAGK